MVTREKLIQNYTHELELLKKLQNDKESYVNVSKHDYTNELSEFDYNKLIPIKSVINNVENIIDLLLNPNCPKTIIEIFNNSFITQKN